MQFQDYPLDLLAQYIPDKATLHRIMIKNCGYFLPKESLCSDDYLLGVLNGKYFSMKLDERKELQLKTDFKVSTAELFEEISKLIDKPLGFKPSFSPGQKWLLDVLNTLDPENKLIVGDPSLKFTRKLPEGSV